jgi:hypothetical protein
MKQPFEIKFDFPLAHSDLIVSLRATAEIHHSDVYFIVRNFHLSGTEPQEQNISMIPDQEIKFIRRDSGRVWVHRESLRESMLSLSIGKAIEKFARERGWDLEREK